MNRLTRELMGLPACLVLLLSAAAAPARDDKPASGPMDHKALDGAIYTNLKEIINHGADLYNSGDWNGCYRLWEGALMNLKPMLAHRGELQKAIDTALANARQDAMLYRRAFVLRTVLDQVRADIKGNAPAKAKDKGESAVDTVKAKTLWGRLGGEAGVTRIVDDLVNGATADPKVDFFRHGKYKPDAPDIAKMKRELVEMISQATGGPLKYTGPDMKKIHQDMGITEAQFDATAGHIKKALEKNKVAEKDVATVMDAVNSYRKQIVAPKKPEEKKPEDKKPTDKKPEDKKPAGTASVQGKITFKGLPLSGGTIAFTSAKEGKAEGKIAGDGSYSILGVKLGEYKVTIETESVNPAKAPAKEKLPIDPKAAAKYVPIPKKYALLETSGLTVSIKEGKQAYDIQLDD